MPPRGPGTAPFTRISSRSGSAWTTSRLSVVTWWPPIRPAIRVPLKTRAGVAQAPMDPGDRCFLWLPWAAPWPLKLCRFMAPAKPLPLDTAMASTRSPAAQNVGGQLLAHLEAAGVVDAQLDEVTARLHPGGGEVALLGLVQGRRPAHAPGDLQGGVALTLGGLHLHHPHGRDPQHRHRHGTVAARPRPGSCRPSRRRSPWSPRSMWSPFRPHAGAPAALAAGHRFGSSAPAPAPGSHANAPPGKTRAERSPGCAPRSPPQCRWALGDVDPACRARNRPDLRRYTMGREACQRDFGPGSRVAAGSDVLDLDLDVDPGGQVEALQGVHRLRGVLDDVDQALVHPHLEVLAAVLVLVG